MALLNTIDKLEDVDEKYRGFYTSKDGNFALDAALQTEDDSELRGKLREFRNSNIDLETRLRDLEKGRDDAVAAAKLAASNAVDDVKKSSDERIAALETAHEAAKAEAAAATTLARRATLSETLGKIGVAQGVKPSALQTFSSVHVTAFDFDENGTAFVKGKEGRPALSEQHAGERMTPEEYVTATLHKEDFWLAHSSGDGAHGDGGGGGGGNVRKITKSEAEANWSTYEKDISSGKVEVVPD
jgi:hypothetical protein